MTPYPSADQSIETMTLILYTHFDEQAIKGHTWKADEYSVEILPCDLPKIPAFRKHIKTLKTKDSVYSLSCRGVQPFGTSGPHWKEKRCPGPHIKYTNTNEN